MPCARSIPFPTGAIMQCNNGNSRPAKILWKKLISARHPLTINCQLFCTNDQDAMNPSRADNTSLGSASV